MKLVHSGNQPKLLPSVPSREPWIEAFDDLIRTPMKPSVPSREPWIEARCGNALKLLLLSVPSREPWIEAFFDSSSANLSASRFPHGSRGLKQFVVDMIKRLK